MWFESGRGLRVGVVVSGCEETWFVSGCGLRVDVVCEWVWFVSGCGYSGGCDWV